MNKKSARTQRQAENALFELMQSKAFATISITEIANTANISRMAFYRNYKTKEDVLNGFIQGEYDRFIADISEHHLDQITQLLHVYFAYFQANPQILLAIVNAGIEGIALRKQTDYFMDFFKRKVKDRQRPSQYEVGYYSGAIFSVLLDWGQSDYQIPVNEMTQWLVKKISKDIDATDLHLDF
ncbi:MAG: TetR/AcrR family transcriptional regulator [Sporolactobacillus sp.]